MNPDNGTTSETTPLRDQGVAPEEEQLDIRRNGNLNFTEAENSPKSGQLGPNSTVRKLTTASSQPPLEELLLESNEAPDGGWGWMVVLASFMIHVIADGVTYSFGVLTPEYIHYYGTSREMIGWLASIMAGMTLCAGPLASVLSRRFGFRAVTICGAILSGFGFSAAYICAELWFLFMTAAVITGMGFGLIYLPAIVTVGIYFEKKRALAIGLAVCGSGIGTFIFSPFIEFLLDNYSWRGSMLIIGAIILNCAVCGVVFVPVPYTKKPMRVSESPLVRSSDLLDLSDEEKLVMEYLQTEEQKRKSSQATTIESGTGSIMERPKGRRRNKSESAENAPSRGKYIKSANGLIYSAPDIRSNLVTRSFLNLSSPRLSHPHLVLASMLNVHNLNYDAMGDTGRSSEKSIKATGDTIADGMKSMFSNVFDVEIIKDPVFLLFAISNFFTSLGFNAPYLYVKDRALQQGIESHMASYLISSIGIGNTFGRIVFGALSTQSWVNRLVLYNTILVVCGICTMASSLCVTYPSMIFYTAAFGMLSGVYVTLTSVVLVDLLGLDKLNESFGITMLFQGIAVCLGPPMAGWIYDQTGSYDGSFWVCGGMIGFSGLMLFPVPFVQRALAKKKKSRVQV